ncbi:MAG: Gfo/Idh/MocA family oxidoreductase [Alkalispirochaeta sp.]
MAVRIAIVGLGRLGLEHARNLHYHVTGADLVAVCSVRQEEIDRVTAEIPVELATLSYDELLKWGKFDGLVIATTSGVHAEQVVAAVDAGVKKIYSEKPIGMDMDEVWKITNTVRDAGNVMFQVGYNHRFDADLNAAREALRSGKIGKPVFLRIVSRDKTLDRDFLMRFSPSSGGLVSDMMTHDYDTARWLLDSDPVRIFGLGGVYHFDGLEEIGDIDNAVILMEFANGTMVQLESSRNAAYGYHAPAEIFGTTGAIQMGNVPRKKRSVYYGADGATEELHQSFFEYWQPTYRAELTDFVACIAEGRTPRVGLEDGFKAVEWAFAAAEAVREKKVVEYKSAF